MPRSILLAIALSIVVVLAWWWPNRLQDPAFGPAAAAKFNCLSFEPYRPGQSPLTDHFATEAEADQDLALLAPITRAVRTYAAIEGRYEIAALAHKHGVKVWQGIWLGGDPARNAQEMARAIDIAHRFPDTVERVVVGNEVLLRRDLPPAALIADIDHVRAAVHQPVAYADVSDFWDQFPEVAPHVDVVMIHLLPYWEDVPTGIGHAVATVGQVYDHFAARFAGKRVSIGETGWPSRGRQRRDAVPGRLNEARFLRGFMALAAEKRFDYNFIEAFDQDWKYHDEGVMGANWGLFADDRTLKIPPAGPLSEDPLWPWYAAWSVGFGLALTGLALRARAPNPLQATLLAMTLGAAWGAALQGTWPVLYDVHAAIAGLVNLAGQALLAVLAVQRVVGAPRPSFRTGAQATVRVVRLLRGRVGGRAGLFEDLCFVFAWAAAVDQVLLVFDPRYRVFPLATYAVPLVVVAARAAQRDLPTGIGGREEVLLATVLTVGAVASAVQEGALNAQSLAWNAAALVLTVPLWNALRPWRRDASV